MGCDIHVCLEKHIHHDWHTANEWTLSKDDDEDEGEWFDNDMSIGRDYLLFSILGDVRSDGSVEPMSFDRGIPEDCCMETKRYSDQWGSDGHSHGWLSLGDIMSYPWLDPIMTEGVVSLASFDQHDHRWIKHRGLVFPTGFRPESAIIMQPKEAREYIEEKMSRVAWSNRARVLTHGSFRHKFVRVRYEDSHANLCSEFLLDTVLRMQILNNEDIVDDVRLVFFFDN